jgi:hypothetical protein
MDLIALVVLGPTQMTNVLLLQNIAKMAQKPLPRKLPVSV